MGFYGPLKKSTSRIQVKQKNKESCFYDCIRFPCIFQKMVIKAKDDRKVFICYSKNEEKLLKLFYGQKHQGYSDRNSKGIAGGCRQKAEY